MPHIVISQTFRQPVLVSNMMADMVSVWSTVSCQLEAFSQRGWDGDDADPVALRATTQAQIFTQKLPPGTLLPEVSAGYDGSIGLAWSQPEMTMFAHFPPAGAMDFTFDLPRHGLRYSKRLEANAQDLLDEIRPILDYIRPRWESMVFIVGVTEDTYTSTSAPIPLHEMTGPRLMLNAGRD